MPTTILRAPGFSYHTSIGSLHFKDVLSKDRKADQFGSIFIQQNKCVLILAPAKASKKLSQRGSKKAWKKESEKRGKKCEEKGILFRPIPSKYQEGKQVYQCGLLNIYLQNHVIFVKKEKTWIPTSLNAMLLLPA